MEETGQLSDAVRSKIKQQIEQLREQMRCDVNDLEFETHLHLVKDLERILKRK